MRKKATKAGICINSLCLFVLVAILVGTDVTQVHAATKQKDSVCNGGAEQEDCVGNSRKED